MQFFLKSYFACVAAIAITSFSYADARSAAQSAAISEIINTFKGSVSTEAQPDFAILKSLDFESKSYLETNKLIGARYTYPQGFEIVEHRDLLYVLRYSNGQPARAIIEKYQWSTGELLATYIIPEPQHSISESLVIDVEENKEIAYLRSENMLTRYRLVNGTSSTGTTQKLDSLVKNVAQSFSRRGGNWFIEKFKTKKDDIGQSRGEYAVLDTNFNHVKDIVFSPVYSGYRESQQLQLPKHQGFSVLNDGYAMSMGGYWSAASKITPYNYYGINIFNNEGMITKSKYYSPDTLLSQFLTLGIEGNTIENEGIQMLSDETLVTLQVVRKKGDPGGKLLFLGVRL